MQPDSRKVGITIDPANTARIAVLLENSTYPASFWEQAMQSGSQLTAYRWDSGDNWALGMAGFYLNRSARATQAALTVCCRAS
jgi:hypothetical protein